MLNIMRADLFRLRKSKVLLGIVLGLSGILLLGNLLAAFTHDGVLVLISNGQGLNEVDFKRQGSKMMLECLKGSNVLQFFILPIVLHLFLADFKNNLQKNSLTYKYSRTASYVAKFIGCGLLACLLPLLYGLLSLFWSELFSGFTGTIEAADFLTLGKITLLQVPIYLGIVGVFCLLGVATQSSSIVIAFGSLYQLVVMLVFAIFSSQNLDLSKYEPMTCLNRGTYLVMNNVQSGYGTIILVGCIMTSLSFLAGVQIYSKMEFK